MSGSQRARGKPSVSKPSEPTFKPTSAPVETVRTLFENVPNLNLTNDEISNLINLKLINDDNMFDLEDRDFIYDVAALMNSNSRGYEQIYNFLVSGDITNNNPIKRWIDRRTITLNLPPYQPDKAQYSIRDQALKDAQYFRDRAKITAGPQCSSCGGRNTRQHEVQHRSADEPATLTAKCPDCGHTWTPN